MTTDLFLITYRRQELDLRRRLEHQRVARERASQVAPVRHVGASDAAAMHRWVRATVARVRHAVRDVTAPTACCSPA